MAFVSGVHVFVKALDKTGVKFPASKSDIIKTLGSVKVQISDDEFVEAASIVEGMKPDWYENGAAFMCAYVSAAYQGSLKDFVS
jgi:hypothetical protein